MSDNLSVATKGNEMQAIHTKHIPATNTREAKIKAYTSNVPRGVMVSIDYSLGDVERHFVAAQQFISKHMEYVPDNSVMTYGGSADGKGYCFCFVQSTIAA